MDLHPNVGHGQAKEEKQNVACGKGVCVGHLPLSVVHLYGRSLILGATFAARRCAEFQGE